MLGILFAQIVVFIGGIGAILFSILAWRLRKNVFFYLGLGFLLIYLIYAILNYEYFLLLLDLDNYIFLGLNLSFVIIPTFFLIKSKQTMKTSSLDGLSSEGQVTDKYLDDIINGPDEEIDYE